MSVALSATLPASARNSTFDNIGIVVRRSTTLCTWLSALRRAARSMVNFMVAARSLADRPGADPPRAWRLKPDPPSRHPQRVARRADMLARNPVTLSNRFFFGADPALPPLDST